MHTRSVSVPCASTCGGARARASARANVRARARPLARALVRAGPLKRESTRAATSAREGERNGEWGGEERRGVKVAKGGARARTLASRHAQRKRRAQRVNCARAQAPRHATFCACGGRGGVRGRNPARVRRGARARAKKRARTRVPARFFYALARAQLRARLFWAEVL